MATFTKAHLSGAADGLAVKIAATGTTGTTVHTASSSTSAGEFSEVFCWATNTSAASVQLTIEWGTTTAADGNIIVTVPPKEGLMLVGPGLILHNSKVITAFAAQADVILMVGYANEIA